MLKKLFAVFLAATLLAGGAWGADTDAYAVSTVTEGEATGWSHSDGSSSDIASPSPNTTLAASGDVYAIYNSTSDDLTIAVNLGNISITENVLYAIGANGGVASPPPTVGTGKFLGTIGNLTLDHANAKFTIADNSVISVTGTLTHTDANTFSNAGTLIITGSYVGTSGEDFTNTGNLIFQASSTFTANNGTINETAQDGKIAIDGGMTGAADLFAVAGSGASKGASTIQLTGTSFASDLTADTAYDGIVNTGNVASMAKLNAGAGKIVLGGFDDFEGNLSAEATEAKKIIFTGAVATTHTNGITYGSLIDTAEFENSVSAITVADGKTAIVSGKDGVLSGTATVNSGGILELNVTGIVAATNPVTSAGFAKGESGSTVKLTGAFGSVTTAALNFSAMDGGTLEIGATGTVASLVSAEGDLKFTSDDFTVSGVTTATDGDIIIAEAANATLTGAVTATAATNSITALAGSEVSFGAAVSAGKDITLTGSTVTTATGTFAAGTGKITIDGSTFTGGSTGALTAAAGLVIENDSEASFAGAVTATAGGIAIKNNGLKVTTFNDAVTATAGDITLTASKADFIGNVTATADKIDIGAGSIASFGGGTAASVVTAGSATDDSINVAGTFKTAGTNGVQLGSKMTVQDTGILHIGETVPTSGTAAGLDANNNDISFISGSKLVLDDAIANTSTNVLTNLTTPTLNALDGLINASTIDGAFIQTTFNIVGTNLEIIRNTETSADVIADNIGEKLADYHGSEFFADQGEAALSAAIAATGLEATTPGGIDATNDVALNFHNSLVSYFQQGTAVNGYVFSDKPGSRESEALINGYSGKSYTQGVDAVLRNVSVANLKITSTGSGGRFGTILDQFRLAQGTESFSGNGALASAAPNSLNCYANRFWLGGFGLWEDADYRRGNLGYEYKSGGFILGYDHVFANSLVVGGAFAYSLGDFEDKAALANDSDIDTASFSLYALYRHSSGAFASLSGGYGNSSHDLNTLHRTGNPWEKADYHTNTWNLGGKIGYDWAIGGFRLTPSVGLYHYSSRSGSFNTNLRNNLKITGRQTELPIDLAFRYEGAIGNGARIRLGANAGYAYNFNADDKAKATFTFAGIANSPIIATQGRDNGHSVWNLGAGAGFSAGRFDLDVKYDYYKRAKSDAHQVYGTVGINF